MSAALRRQAQLLDRSARQPHRQQLHVLQSDGAGRVRHAEDRGRGGVRQEGGRAQRKALRLEHWRVGANR